MSRALPESSSQTTAHGVMEGRRQLVSESLRVGNPANHARDLPAQADPLTECQIELEVDAIRSYERNPRRSENAKFAEIKESIRVSGVCSPIAVTRRPGEAHFIVEAGGNTRLRAIQQLWAETQDVRYRRISVLFRPWRSESHVLTAHLIENEQRADMTFWDKANGVLALRVQLEAEAGHTFSLRQMEEAMAGIGMPINTATLTHYLFACDRLRTLGDVVTELSGLDVKTIQPRLNLLKRHAQSRVSMLEPAFYTTVCEPVFQRVADEYRRTGVFSAMAVCRSCDEALASHLGEPVSQLREALTVLARPPRRSAGRQPAESDADRPLLEAILERVRHLSALAGIDHCLRLQADMPTGYRVAVLSSVAGSTLQVTLARRVWNLLALTTLQIDESGRLVTGKNGSEPGMEAVVTPDSIDSGQAEAFDTEAGFVRWLLDAEDEAAGSFCEIVMLVRSLCGSRKRGVHAAVA